MSAPYAFPSPEEIIRAIPRYSLDELEAILSHVDLALRLQKENRLSTDAPGGWASDSEGEGLAGDARRLLRDGDLELTQADMALLCAVILSESYRQGGFSSRHINDVIEESDRPRVINITSPVSSLIGHGYLHGSTKRLSLSAEGRTKVRDLIEMLLRRRAVA
jgi:hypothetical protein